MKQFQRLPVQFFPTLVKEISVVLYPNIHRMAKSTFTKWRSQTKQMNIKSESSVTRRVCVVTESR